jgi:hypothetical protein
MPVNFVGGWGEMTWGVGMGALDVWEITRPVKHRARFRKTAPDATYDA